MDETGLNYRAQPRKSLAKEAASGGKDAKDRITVGLTVNSDGTHRVRPLIIHKAKKPRCFGTSFDPNELVDYYHNPKAWMNKEVNRVSLCTVAHLYVIILQRRRMLAVLSLTCAPLCIGVTSEASSTAA